MEIARRRVLVPKKRFFLQREINLAFHKQDFFWVAIFGRGESEFFIKSKLAASFAMTD